MAIVSKKRQAELVIALKKYKGIPISIDYVSIAASGMSRKVKIYADGENITPLIADYLGYTYNQIKGMTLNGYGSDPGFELLYSVNNMIAKHDGMSLPNPGYPYVLQTVYRSL